MFTQATTGKLSLQLDSFAYTLNTLRLTEYVWTRQGVTTDSIRLSRLTGDQLRRRSVYISLIK